MEAKIFEYQEELTDQGLSEEEVNIKVAQYRKKIQDQSNSGPSSKARKTTDSHASSALKEAENKKLRSAFGIEDDFVSGASFDPQAQEERRVARETDR